MAGILNTTPSTAARRLRLAHVTAVFPPYWSGTSNVAYFNALELARLGHDVHVFTAQQPLNGYCDPAELTVHRLSAPLRIGNAPFTPGLVPNLARFDLVHLHWPYMFGAELTWLSTRLSGIPYVLTYHLDLRADRRRIFGIYQRLWGPRLARSARKIIAVTANHLRSSQVYPYIAGRPDDIVEIANGVDIEHFHPRVSGAAVRANLRIPTEADVIIFVAAMDSAHEYKGVPELLQAFAQLDRPQAWLLLVGDGDLRPGYEARAGALPADVRSRIRFAGAVAHLELPAYYAAADLGALPSLQPESFGMALIEAMACGKPVVASDSPGVRSVVRDGEDGFLVRPGDVQDLAAKLEAMLADRALREGMGRRGAADVRSRYSWRALAQKLDRLYADALMPASQVRASAA